MSIKLIIRRYLICPFVGHDVFLLKYTVAQDIEPFGLRVEVKCCQRCNKGLGTTYTPIHEPFAKGGGHSNDDHIHF